MLGNLTWAAVIVIGGVLIGVATWGPRRLLPDSPRRARGSRIILAVVVLAVVLLGLVLLVRVRGYDHLDAAVVGALAAVRSKGLVAIFTSVTTIGDVVPSLVMATIVALALFARSRRIDVALILPVAIVVQVSLQDELGHLAGVTIAQIAPHLDLGGAGPIPSGSMSRLFVVFILGSVLWARYSAGAAAGFLLTGQALLLIELVSRLYLGRHFLIDILGGLLFGVLLMIGGSWLLAGIERMRGEQTGPPVVDAPAVDAPAEDRAPESA